MESIIKKYLKTPRYYLKKQSKFNIVINEIRERDSLFINFLDLKENLEFIPFEILGIELFANLEKSKTKNNLYFSKRLFVMEYNYIKSYSNLN